MSELYDIIVIGAGICGLAVASALAPDARVLVLEREPQPGYHATGRASAVMQFNEGTAAVRALTRASLDLLTQAAPELDGQTLMSPRALVRLARLDQLDQLHSFFREASPQALCRWLDTEEVMLWIPMLRPGYGAAGVLESEVRELDVALMQSHHLARLKAHGARLCCGGEVTAMARQGDTWQVTSEAGVFRAAVVVNAAGAWAGQIGAMASARPIGLTPRRRTSLAVAAPPGIDAQSLPMVWDIDECFFIMPEKGRFKATTGEDMPCLPCDARPPPLEIAKGMDRLTAAFDLTVDQPDAAWAGLRTFAVDEAPVCGFDPQAAGFFWLAGQGGTGLQTAPALSQIAADLILGRVRAGAGHAALPGLPLACLAPERLPV
jgi:D-arginine dehydrogenase